MAQNTQAVFPSAGPWGAVKAGLDVSETWALPLVLALMGTGRPARCNSLNVRVFSFPLVKKKKKASSRNYCLILWRSNGIM